jgi:hypothetical protein
MSNDDSIAHDDVQQELNRLKLELADQFMGMERLEAHIAAAKRAPTNIETMKLADFRVAVREARDRIVELEYSGKSD